MSQHDPVDNPSGKKNPADLINKYFDGVLPIKDGRFTANLLPSHINNVYPAPHGELTKFRSSEDRTQHNTYGMNPGEREDAIIHSNEAKTCLVDKNDMPVNVLYRIYNVTADKKLICRPDNLMNEGFNHSSITRDGAIECAGHITIENGIITMINNSSGHYQPTLLDLYNAINTIQKYGKNVFSEKCEISAYINEKVGSRNFTMTEFKEYMHAPITNAKGEEVPRVAQMRIDRYDAHRAIGSVKHELNKEDTDPTLFAPGEYHPPLDTGTTAPAVAPSATVNQHTSSTPLSTQPLSFDAMEVYQIRDAYSNSDTRTKLDIINLTDTYSPKSAELCQQLVQLHSMYEVEHTKTVNHILTNMIGWSDNSTNSREEIKNLLNTNSYFTTFGNHCTDPQVKAEFFDKIGKLAVISGIKFEDLAMYNVSEDGRQMLEKSYKFHKELDKTAHTMKRFNSTENISSTSSSSLQHRPRSRTNSQSL